MKFYPGSNNTDLNLGTHPLVRRFMKGVFILRPALPRYNVTWDVNIVLNYLKYKHIHTYLTT